MAFIYLLTNFNRICFYFNGGNQFHSIVSEESIYHYTVAKLFKNLRKRIKNKIQNKNNKNKKFWTRA